MKKKIYRSRWCRRCGFSFLASGTYCFVCEDCKTTGVATVSPIVDLRFTL